MAGENEKEEQDALDALELEAKEFDKVSLTRPPASAKDNLTETSH